MLNQLRAMKAYLSAGFLLTVLLSLALVTPGGAAVRSVDLRSVAGSQAFGAYKVARAGDVNGDGFEDVLVAEGDIRDTERGVSTAGTVYVVFGSAGDSRVDTDNLGSRGFAIHGASTGDYAAEAAGAGDINGDGLHDVLVGALGADNNGRASSGSVYVVFGKRSTEDVDLASFDLSLQGAAGFRIDGASDLAYAGADVAALADLNDDGRDEVVVGAPGLGRTYVVYGKEGAHSVDLHALHLGLTPDVGFAIRTPIPTRANQYSVASAGDVNADGRDDLIIGVVRSPRRRGRAYVVFTSNDMKNIDLRTGDFRGFTVWGRAEDGLGYSVAGLGDLNGDRRSDLAIGSPTYDTRRDRVLIIFGKRSTGNVRVADLDGRGYVIRGKCCHDETGGSVSAAGDVNRDGRADLIVGAHRSSNNGRLLSGSAYVVYGKHKTSRILLARLGSRGFRIDGERGADENCGNEFCLGDMAGLTVAGLGDFNGDAIRDVVVGAWLAGPEDEGKAYVIPGQP